MAVSAVSDLKHRNLACLLSGKEHIIQDVQIGSVEESNVYHCSRLLFRLPPQIPVPRLVAPVLKKYWEK